MLQQLPDVQESKPNVEIALNRVGISKLILPVYVRKKLTAEGESVQHTTAKIACYVDLPADKKGINMSRLPIIIQGNIDKPLRGATIQDVAEQIRIASEANECEINYEFHYFTQKKAPVTGRLGYLDHKVNFNGVVKEDRTFEWKITVESIGTSLCPCSKEISKGGAHNQKCYVSITVTPKENALVWIEDLIEVVDKSCSCEIWSVLKRPDEKYVTERAYDNPMFVEDIARECYKHLIGNDNITYFKVRVASDESIHVHRAEAIIESEVE